MTNMLRQLSSQVAAWVFGLISFEAERRLRLCVVCCFSQSHMSAESFVSFLVTFYRAHMWQRFSPAGSTILVLAYS